MTSPRNSRPLASVRWCVWLVGLLLHGCMGDTSQLAFIPVSAEGWAAGDTLHCTLEPSLLAQPARGGERGVYVLLHTDGYAYRNLALCIGIEQDTLLCDTVRTYWLDECAMTRKIGSCCEYTLPVGNVAVNDTLPLNITLQHRMDTLRLAGIRAIGIRVASHIAQPGEVVWHVDW